MKYNGNSQRPTIFKVGYEINNERKVKTIETYRGVSMGFEGKLSEIYNKIVNEIDGMIPVEWGKGIYDSLCK